MSLIGNTAHFSLLASVVFRVSSAFESSAAADDEGPDPSWKNEEVMRYGIVVCNFNSILKTCF